MVCYLPDYNSPHPSHPPLDQDIRHRFADIICSWMLRRQFTCLCDSEKEWIELGFARFRTRPQDPCGEQIVVDEPLIILAAAQYLNAHTTFGLHNHVLNKLNHAAGRGTHFEEFLAVYFAQAFGPTVCLCDLFYFGNDVPIWAESEGVELVAASRDRSFHITRHFCGDPVGTSSSLCCDLQHAADTVEWFRNPNTVLCFPDIHLGPDIVFFLRLSDGSIICVIIQAKFHSQLRLSKSNQADAVSTLKPSDFYRNDVSSPHALVNSVDPPLLQKLTLSYWNRYCEDIYHSVCGLSKIDDEKWFPGQLPFLRVLATFPAEPHKEDAPIVTLNMDYCIEKMDKENALVNLITALVPPTKRRNDQVGRPGSKKLKKEL
jgi:hypothetical protein